MILVEVYLQEKCLVDNGVLGIYYTLTHAFYMQHSSMNWFFFACSGKKDMIFHLFGLRRQMLFDLKVTQVAQQSHVTGTS